RTAVVVAALGLLVDLCADGMWIHLPAEVRDPETDISVGWLASSASFCGLVIANGLYTLAIVFATIDLPADPWVRRCAAVTVAGGIALVVAGFLTSPVLIAVATGPMVVAFIAWAFLASREAQPLAET